MSDSAKEFGKSLEATREMLDERTRELFHAGAEAISNIPEDAYEQMSKEDFVAIVGLLMLAAYFGKGEETL